MLGFLGVEPQLGGVLRIAARIDAVGGEELLGQVVDQALVEILAAQPHVAVGGQGAERVPSISRIVTSKVPPPRS